ncbi:MAG: DALR domain-containing protein, partial [Candidatus Zixiibacteriota bacterium]
GSAAAVMQKAKESFEQSLDDDLNISGALGAVFDYIRDINRMKAENKLSAAERDEARELITSFDTVLDLCKQEDKAIDSDVEALIEQRTEARKNKDFAAADKIRDQLVGMGILLEDTPQGVKWKRKQV